MKVSELIDKAIEKVRQGWCQGASARGPNGFPCSPLASTACAWCMDGALECVSPRQNPGDRMSPKYRRAVNYLNTACFADGSNGFTAWNDMEGRTQQQVITVMQKVADKARAYDD